jgi:hypothetical protein
MKASKCRVCGKVEWGHVCATPGEASYEPDIAPPPGPRRLRVMMPPLAPEPWQPRYVASKPERKGGRKADPRFIDPETGLYSERLYKRDYMRKRRASKA